MERVASRAEVQDALFAVLAESRGSTLDDVRADCGSGGEIDSLEGVELIAAAEERFGITVSDEELSSHVCSSIPLLAELVVSKLGG